MMAISFGGARELIVSVQAQTQKFKQDIDKATNSINNLKNKTNQAANDNRKFTTSFSGLINKLGGYKVVLAAAAATVGTLIASQAKAVDEMAKMADRLNITVASFQAFKLAGEQAGANADQVADSMFELSKRIAEASLGQGEAAAALDRLGLSAQAINQLPTDEKFKLIAQALSDFSDEAQRAVIGEQLLGEGFKNLEPLIQNGAAGIQAAEQRIRELGLAMSETEADAIEGMNDSLGLLLESVINLARQGLAIVAPAIQFITEVITTKVIPAFNLLLQVVGIVVDAFMAMSNGVKAVIGEMVNFVIEGIAKLVGGLGKFASNVVGMFGGLAEAIGADEMAAKLNKFQISTESAGDAIRAFKVDTTGNIADATSRFDSLLNRMDRIKTVASTIVFGPAEITPIDIPVPEEYSLAPGTSNKEQTGGKSSTSRGAGSAAAKLSEEQQALQKLNAERTRYLEQMVQNIEQQNQLNIAQQLYSDQLDTNVVSIEALRQVTEAGFQAGTQEFDLAVQLTEQYLKQKEAIDALAESQGNATTAAQQFSEGMKSQILTLNDAANQAGSRFGQFFNDIIDGAVRGQQNFKEMAVSIIQDLTAMILKAMLWKALEPFFGVGGAGGIFGGLFGGLFSANGNVFGQGGNVVPFAKGGIVGSPTIIPMPGSRKVGLMGEAGPEAIMPLKRGPDGKLGVEADQAGGGINNVFNVTINPGPNQSPADARAFAEEFNRSVDQRITQTMLRQNAKGRSIATPQRKVVLG